LEALTIEPTQPRELPEHALSNPLAVLPPQRGYPIDHCNSPLIPQPPAPDPVPIQAEAGHQSVDVPQDDRARMFSEDLLGSTGVHSSCEGSPPTTGALFSAWREAADEMRDRLGDALPAKQPQDASPVERPPGTSSSSSAGDAEPQLDIHGLQELGPSTSVVETVTDTITANPHAPTTDAPSVEEPGAGVDPH
jgi:hypothetical protein